MDLESQKEVAYLSIIFELGFNERVICLEEHLESSCWQNGQLSSSMYGQYVSVAKLTMCVFRKLKTKIAISPV